MSQVTINNMKYLKVLRGKRSKIHFIHKRNDVFTSNHSWSVNTNATDSGVKRKCRATDRDILFTQKTINLQFFSKISYTSLHLTSSAIYILLTKYIYLIILIK